MRNYEKYMDRADEIYKLATGFRDIINKRTCLFFNKNPYFLPWEYLPGLSLILYASGNDCFQPSYDFTFPLFPNA